MVFWQVEQKRPVKPLKKAEAQFAYQCLNRAYRCGSRLALLLLLMNICTTVSLNAHADSDTYWQQGPILVTGDPSCNVSILLPRFSLGYEPNPQHANGLGSAAAV